MILNQNVKLQKTERKTIDPVQQKLNEERLGLLAISKLHFMPNHLMNSNFISYNKERLKKLSQDQQNLIQRINSYRKLKQTSDINKSLFENKTKIPYKQVAKGTCSIMKITNKEKSNINFIENLQKEKNNVRNQIVQWIQLNEKELVTTMNINRDSILDVIEALGSVDQHEIKEILGFYHYKFKTNFIDKLYWLLDVNQSGKIEPYDMIMSSQFFETNYFQENLVKMFFQICDFDKTNYLTENKIIRILENNLQQHHERQILQKNKFEILKFLNPQQSKFQLTLEKLIQLTYSKQTMQEIIFKNVNLMEGKKVKNDTQDQNREIINYNNMQSVTFMEYENRLISAFSELNQIKHEFRQTQHIVQELNSQSTVNNSFTN